MSAIRGTDRRATRSLNSSPYSRQAPKKKSSSWSFGIGDFLSYFNPLRLARSSELEDDTDNSDEFIQDSQASAQAESVPSSSDAPMGPPNDSSVSGNHQVPRNPAESLSARGHQLASDINGSQQTPRRAYTNVGLTFSTPTRVAPPDDTQLSPAESLEKVHSFLKEKDGQALSEWETRGLLTFLEKNVQGDSEKREPFRFSSSPSRTPRDVSPVFGVGTPDASLAMNGEPSTPRKTLSKNPNGIYILQGGGSARPRTRNRYQSPSFGTRMQPPTIKLTPAKTDTKRRRVGEDADKSSSQRVPFPAISPQKPAVAVASASSPAPAPAPSQARPNIFPVTNGTPSTPNGTVSGAPKTNGTSAPRLRTSGLPTKPTAPTVPSPLRQTWGQGDSPPQTPASKSNPTPTKAASFMTELIKEVTPPKKPDLSNPYQTASPVKPSPRKPMAKRPRATPKAAAPPPSVKTPQPSPQAIIEATVPKGSKRSRPPPEFFNSSRTEPTSIHRHSPPSETSDLPSKNGFSGASGISGGTKTPPVAAEEIVEDDNDHDNRVAKKQKMSTRTVTMEEIDDVDMPSNSHQTSSFLRPTEIIEPFDNGGSSSSKLTQPASASNLFPTNAAIPPLKSAFSVKSSAPKEPSKLRFSYQADKTESTPATHPSTSFSPPPTPRLTPAKLPTVPQRHENVDPKQTVIAMAERELPTYLFPSQSSIFPKLDDFANAQDAAKAKPITSLPTFDFSTPLKAPSSSSSFNWAAAGITPPTAPSGVWTCAECMLSNPETVDKCTVCEAMR